MFRWEIHKEHFPFFHWDETSYLFLFLAAFFPISFSFFWPQSFNFFPCNQMSMKSYSPSRADCLVLMMRRFFFQSLVNHKCFLIFFCFFACYLQSLQLWMVALDDRIRSLFVMCFQVGDGITKHLNKNFCTDKLCTVTDEIVKFIVVFRKHVKLLKTKCRHCGLLFDCGWGRWVGWFQQSTDE